MEQSLLNYKTYGSNLSQPLVIVHGLFGSLDNWMSLAKLWSTNYFVLAIDLRNHGRSFHSDDMSFESMTADIINVMDRERLDAINLLGHSLGGKVAMDFAARYPERLNKLIVVDVAPYIYNPHHNEVFTALAEVNLEKMEDRVSIENEIRHYLKDEGVVQFMVKNAKRNEDTLVFEWKFNLPVLQRDYEYLIQRIPFKGFKGRVLFLGGDRSQYISKETSSLIFDLYPQFELEYVSNAGHWVHADNPREFYEKVTKFLEQ